MTEMNEGIRRGQVRYIEGRTEVHVQSVNHDDRLAAVLIDVRMRGGLRGCRLISVPFCLLERERRVSP